MEDKDKKFYDAINKAMEEDDFYDTILEAAFEKKCKQLQAENERLVKLIKLAYRN